MSRKRYVLVGTGGRSRMFSSAILGDFAEHAELLALCDTNQTRMDFHNMEFQEQLGLEKPLPTYKADEFDKMIEEQKPDCVIVTTMDRVHHRYICRAMELGCDAISEKPMTVDSEKCQQIIDTIKKTGKNLIVTFNYRYAPRNSKVKEVLQEGLIGDVLSVHFEWLLDTQHGADYFRRWHRDKRNSGGLLVHKATHHFDLVNWWIDSSPKTVFAMGDLRFYGKENAEERGVTQFYERSRNNPIAAKDPFALKVDPAKDKGLMGLYYNAEHEDGYHRDQSVFGHNISIEDTLNLLVKYRNKAVMSYSLTAYNPWEGYRVMFNGTKGRLEFQVKERSYVSGGHEDFNTPGNRELYNDDDNPIPEIIFQPLWGKPEIVTYEQTNLGGHGGGDIRLLNDIFVGDQADPLHRAAGYVDGVHSIMTGIAGNLSINRGLPVDVDTLVHW